MWNKNFKNAHFFCPSILLLEIFPKEIISSDSKQNKGLKCLSIREWLNKNISTV